jgi:hypothetical protein
MGVAVIREQNTLLMRPEIDRNAIDGKFLGWVYALQEV